MPAGVSAITPLANITLGSAQNTVTFSSISQSYRDLILIYQGQASSYSGNAPSMRFNSDSSVAYPCVLMTGNGTSTFSSLTGFTWINISDADYLSPNTQQLITVQIMDYSATDKHKSTLSRANNPGQGVNVNAGRWPSTSAITTITLAIAFGGSNFNAGSTFALYGVSS
jgi:hypothetical protein